MVWAHHPPSNLQLSKLALHSHTNISPRNFFAVLTWCLIGWLTPWLLLCTHTEISGIQHWIAHAVEPMHSNTIYPASPLNPSMHCKKHFNFLLLPFCIKLQVSRQITFLYFVLMVCIHVLKVFFSLPEETLYLFKLSSQPTHIKKKGPLLNILLYGGSPPPTLQLACEQVGAAPPYKKTVEHHFSQVLKNDCMQVFTQCSQWLAHSEDANSRRGEHVW